MGHLVCVPLFEHVNLLQRIGESVGLLLQRHLQYLIRVIGYNVVSPSSENVLYLPLVAERKKVAGIVVVTV